eukprot:scaffold275122_cov31-Prasinocladus_malaysianus.AAC.2
MDTGDRNTAAQTGTEGEKMVGGRGATSSQDLGKQQPRQAAGSEIGPGLTQQRVARGCILGVGWWAKGTDSLQEGPYVTLCLKAEDLRHEPGETLMPAAQRVAHCLAMDLKGGPAPPCGVGTEEIEAC